MKLFLQKNAKFSSTWGSAPSPPKQPPIADFWLRACYSLQPSKVKQLLEKVATSGNISPTSASCR